MRVVGEAGITSLHHSFFDQAWIVFKRGAEESFSWQKHHHKFRRWLELLGIRLGAQTLHVLADLARVRTSGRIRRRSSSVLSSDSR